MNINEIYSVVFAHVGARRSQPVNRIIDAVYADPLFSTAIREGGRDNDQLDAAIEDALTTYGLEAYFD